MVVRCPRCDNIVKPEYIPNEYPIKRCPECGLIMMQYSRYTKCIPDMFSTMLPEYEDIRNTRQFGLLGDHGMCVLMVVNLDNQTFHQYP